MATDATTPVDNSEPTTALVQSYSINAEQLREVNSFDDALRLMEETYGADALALASDALGDGFALLEEKDQLIGVACAFVNWKESLGDFGPFVIAHVVTEKNGKYVLIDGSTGIYEQLSLFAKEKGREGGLIARKGLRRSDYEKEILNSKTGEMVKTPATTYYIDTSA